ncbi:MAG: hypothetical protein ABWZ26_04115 [Candidatus Nanopelagicales bacterium]
MPRTAHAALVGAVLIVPTGLLLAASPAAAEPWPPACQYGGSGQSAMTYYSRLCENAALTKAQIEHNELSRLDQQPAATPADSGNEGSSVPTAAIAAGAISVLAVSALVVGIAVSRSRAGSRPDLATPTPPTFPL